MNNKSLLSAMRAGSTGLLVVITLLLAACVPAAAPTLAPAATSAPAATMAPAPTLAPAATTAATQSVPNTGSSVVVNVAADPKLGNILVDSKGMTLYIFTKDGPDKSNCAGNCAKAWPPLTVQGNPVAGRGVDASMLGTAALADGSMIVTYNKMPLYYFAKDTKPGDATGQLVGGVWFVVSPDGKPVGMQSAAPTAAASSVAPLSTAGKVTVNMATDPKLGQILVDAKGMTLYIFTKDGPDKSTCVGNCLKAWPPLVTQGNPMAGTGVNASLLGSTSLADGSMIVTYNKMPLYYWAKDTKPGDTTGQGVGSVWFVISPSGKPVGQ